MGYVSPQISQPDPPTLSQFRAEFPELAAHDDALVTRSLLTAYELHSAKPRATLYLAAHLLILEAENTGQVDGGSGEVARETSVGGKAVDYRTMAEGSGADVFYSRTSYGRTFMALERRAARRGLSVMAL